MRKTGWGDMVAKLSVPPAPRQPPAQTHRVKTHIDMEQRLAGGAAHGGERRLAKFPHIPLFMPLAADQGPSPRPEAAAGPV